MASRVSTLGQEITKSDRQPADDKTHCGRPGGTRGRSPARAGVFVGELLMTLTSRCLMTENIIPVPRSVALHHGELGGNDNSSKQKQRA